MEDLNEKSALKESKLFLPMVIGGAFVLGLGATYGVIQLSNRGSDSSGETVVQASREQSEKEDTGKTSGKQSNPLDGLFGAAPKDAPAVPGGVKETLDKNLAQYEKEYVYTDLENLDKSKLYGPDGKPTGKYFPGINRTGGLWHGEGKRTIVPTGDTEELDCKNKTGKFDKDLELKDLKIDVVGVISYPESKTVGPLIKEGYLRQCFEHSTIGAALAAANLLFSEPLSLDFSEDDMQRKIMYSKTRETYNKINFTYRTILALDSLSNEMGSLNIEAFRIDRIDESGAKVLVYYVIYPLQGQPIMYQRPITLIWEKGDWRIGQLEDFQPVDMYPSNVTYYSQFWESSDDEPWESLPDGGQAVPNHGVPGH